MKSLKGSHLLRKGRVCIQGQAYVLTTVVKARKPVFFQPGPARIVLQSLEWLEKEKMIDLEAAVVMPDHLHFVAWLQSDTLSRIMQSLKGYTARMINSLIGQKGSFWQTQYHDHAIRKDEVLERVVMYCLTNPVRAGLVDDFHEYPFWYCKWDV